MSTNLEVGIVGLPNVGKSTLFNAITKAGAEAANYPFCTIEPNVGVVDVPDKRLDVLSDMFKSKKIVPAAMRFVDIAGLVKGASKGEGLGNKFLSHIREVDAVAEVVRCFEDGNITHVEGSIDPLRDIDIINTELCLADMETVEKRQERLVKLAKTGDKKVKLEQAVMEKVMAGLSDGVPARRLGLTEEELPTLVRQWRSANPHITRLWWDVDEAVMTAVRDKTSTYAHGIRFHVQSGMLFIHLPSGRDLCYAKPRIGENQFGSPAVTYMGVGATKKWERIESYGPKFVENIVQGISRDLLCYAMRTLRCCDIVAHVHDEIILEADPRVSLDAVCEQMGRTPPWAKGLVLRADGYECEFYKKD